MKSLFIYNFFHHKSTDLFKLNNFVTILEWLRETGRDENFEEMSKTGLADTLCLFYPSVRQKPTTPDEKPKTYAKQSFVNIRSSINRHLQLPPFNHTWDITKDSEFKTANKSFSGN